MRSKCGRKIRNRFTEIKQTFNVRLLANGKKKKKKLEQHTVGAAAAENRNHYTMFAMCNLLLMLNFIIYYHFVDITMLHPFILPISCMQFEFFQVDSQFRHESYSRQESTSFFLISGTS